MKISIFSNCQAVPLGQAIKAMRPEDTVDWFQVHHLGSDKALYDRAKLAQSTADIIIYAPVADNYPTDIARSSWIEEHCKQALVKVPMLFFRGLSPDLTYLGSSNKRLFKGPMEDYHSEIVIESVILRLPVEVTIGKFVSESEYHNRGYFKIFFESLEELRRRGQECDISGAELVEKYVYDVPTFYTVNHPNNTIMTELARRVLKHLGLTYFYIPADFIPISLGNGAIWPPSDTLAKYHGLKYGGCNLLKTFMGGQRFIKYSDFIRECYSLYLPEIETVLQQPQVTGILKRLGISQEEALKRHI